MLLFVSLYSGFQNIYKIMGFILHYIQPVIAYVDHRWFILFIQSSVYFYTIVYIIFIKYKFFRNVAEFKRVFFEIQSYIQNKQSCCYYYYYPDYFFLDPSSSFHFIYFLITYLLQNITQKSSAIIIHIYKILSKVFSKFTFKHHFFDYNHKRI